MIEKIKNKREREREYISLFRWFGSAGGRRTTLSETS